MTDALMTYTCDNMRPVQAENIREAANIFARRIYGKNGYARTYRNDCWTMDGTSGTWECFVGKDVKGDPGTTVGRNIWIYGREG
jgi:hypothetical protein